MGQMTGYDESLGSVFWEPLLDRMEAMEDGALKRCLQDCRQEIVDVLGNSGR